MIKIKKKVTIDEFNKDFFNDWTNIKKITPHFEEWHSIHEDEEETTNKEVVIERIDIEFDNGEKLSIFPFSNKDDTDEDICTALKIVEYKGSEVNWRLPKK